MHDWYSSVAHEGEKMINDFTKVLAVHDLGAMSLFMQVSLCIVSVVGISQNRCLKANQYILETTLGIKRHKLLDLHINTQTSENQNGTRWIC